MATFEKNPSSRTTGLLAIGIMTAVAGLATTLAQAPAADSESRQLPNRSRG